MAFDRKIVFLLILIATIIFGANVYIDSSRNTTYQQVMQQTGQIDSDSVYRITIVSELRLLNKTATLRIEERELIRQLIYGPSEMKLKKTSRSNRGPVILDNYMYIEPERVFVYFDQTQLAIRGQHYKVVDEMGENKLLTLIQGLDLNWELE